MAASDQKILLIFYGAKGFGPPWNEGLKNTVFSWMQQLAASGVKFYVISNIDFQEPGIEIYYLPQKGTSFFSKYLYLLRLCFYARKLMAKEKITCLLFSIFEYSILVPILLLGNTRSHKILAPASRKFIEQLEIRGYEICPAPNWLKRYILSSFNRIICLSKNLRDEIIKLDLINPETVFFLPPAPLDLEKLTPGIKSRQTDEMVISHLGSFAQVRGIEVLLKAVHSLSNPKIKIQLAWEGSGDETNIKTMIRELNLEKQVLIEGTVDKVKFLSASQVYVFPMLKQNNVLDYPLSIIEAMLMEQVVVASDFPTYRELINPGITGYLYPPGDYRALSEILRILYLQRETIRQIGQQARQSVLQMYADFKPQKMAEIFGLTFDVSACPHTETIKEDVTP